VSCPLPCSLTNLVSTSMRAKLAGYCLALLLHMGHMAVDLTLLQRDLSVKEMWYVCSESPDSVI